MSTAYRKINFNSSKFNYNKAKLKQKRKAIIGTTFCFIYDYTLYNFTNKA